MCCIYTTVGLTGLLFPLAPFMTLIKPCRSAQPGNLWPQQWAMKIIFLLTPAKKEKQLQRCRSQIEKPPHKNMLGRSMPHPPIRKQPRSCKPGPAPG